MTGVKSVDARRADLVRDGVLDVQFGMLGLDGAQLTDQRVVVGVGDRRRVVHVVRLVVRGDLDAQSRGALGRLHDTATIAAPSTIVGSLTR